MALPIALGLYSVRDIYQENFAACLAEVAAIGYVGVECFGAPHLPASEVKEALNRHQLALAGWHLPIELLEGDALTDTIEYLLQVGCTRAIVPYMPPEIFRTRADVLALAARLDAIRTRLSYSQIAVGYHNHAEEFVPMADGQLPWALLMDNTSIIAQLDTGNALSSGTPGLSLADLIERWPGRSTTVHLKPYAREKGFATMFGEDDTDWPAFLRLAEGCGGASWAIVEYEEESVPQLEAARRCLEALKAMA